MPLRPTSQAIHTDLHCQVSSSPMPGPSHIRWMSLSYNSLLITTSATAVWWLQLKLGLTCSSQTPQLAGRIIHCQDRNSDSSKSREGGLFLSAKWLVYQQQDYRPTLFTCSGSPVRPFFISPELTVETVTTVYIPPHANVIIALTHLLATINRQQCAHPRGWANHSREF